MTGVTIPFHGHLIEGELLVPVHFVHGIGPDRWS